MPTKAATLGEQLVQSVQHYAAAIAILTLIAAAVIYILWRPRGMPRALVGPQRWHAVPWQLPEVLMATLVLFFLVGLLFDAAPILHRKLDPQAFAGFESSAAYNLLVGPYDLGLSSGLTDVAAGLVAAPVELSRRIAETRTLWLAQIILFPFLIYLVIDVLRRLVNAKPYQMGLHLNRWRENLTLGCMGWLIAMPIVILVFIVVKLEFWETLWGRPTEHPVAKLIFEDPSTTTWILAAITTVLVAPLKEEFLFRGIIQPYLIRWPIASDLLIVFSISFAAISLFGPGTSTNQGQGMGPVLFVFVVAPGYYFFEQLTWRWLPEPGAARGIFATSLFFAAFHAAAWPTPIPLFLLSVGFGALAYRTGSLIVPITMHALFNATGMIVTYLEYLQRMARG